ncbi:MAG: hypothetical protein Q7S21_05610 [archaeon]|nr:hypothetical protein [archaeon]
MPKKSYGPRRLRTETERRRVETFNSGNFIHFADRLGKVNPFARTLYNEVIFVLKNLPEKREQILKLANNLYIPMKIEKKGKRNIVIDIDKESKWPRARRLNMDLWNELMVLRAEAMESIKNKKNQKEINNQNSF